MYLQATGAGAQCAPHQVLIGLSEFVVDRINWDLYPGLIALLGEVHTIMSKFDQIFT